MSLFFASQACNFAPSAAGPGFDVLLIVTPREYLLPFGKLKANAIASKRTSEGMNRGQEGVRSEAGS